MPVKSIRDVWAEINAICKVVSINTRGEIVFDPSAPQGCRAAVQAVVNAWLALADEERNPGPEYWAGLGPDRNANRR